MIGQHYYTWCPADTGCEGISGFQTRAKSPSITGDIEKRIGKFCSRYELPRTLGDLKTRSESLAPDEVAACPEAIHFYPATESLLGLTRIRLAREQKGRGGNFFAHTFVFPWGALRPFGSNPFALARSSLFKDSAEGAPKELEDFVGFPEPPDSTGYGGAGWPGQGVPDEQALLGLLACLLAPGEAARPIILCPTKWSDAAALIEAALLLLPPSYRSTIGFSTYEADPYRLLIGGEHAETPSQRIIGTISPEEGGRFQFREDEFATRFYVFDACRGRESEKPAPSEYARYVCGAAGQADVAAIEGLHSVVERLGAGLDQDLWHKLVPAACLMGRKEQQRMGAEAAPIKLGSAAECLRTNCRTPARAVAGLGLLWEASRGELANLPTGVAQQVLAACGELLTRIDEKDAFRVQRAPELVEALRELLLSGCYVVASDLLCLAGTPESTARTDVLRQGLSNAQGQGWPKAGRWADDTSERQAFVDVLREGLVGISHDEQSVAIIPGLILSGFSVSASAHCLRQAWSAIGGWVLTDGLPRLPREQAAEVLGNLAALLEQQGIHDGHVQLIVWRLRHAPPPKEKAKLLSDFVIACRRCEEPVAAVNKALTEVEDVLPDQDMASLYVHLFSEGGGEVRHKVAEHYQHRLDGKQDDAARWKFRRVAASSGGADLLAWECSAELFPWSDEAGRTGVRAWLDNVLMASPDVAVVVAAEICKVARQQEDPGARVRALSVCLEEIRASRLPDRRPAVALAEALTLSAPLRCVGEKAFRKAIEGVVTSTWCRAARACLEVSSCFASARRMADGDRPALPLLLRDNKELPDLLPALGDTHWAEACEWILSGLHGRALDDRETVASVVLLTVLPMFFRAEGSAQEPTIERSRACQLAELVASQLRSELLSAPFRKDLTTHVNCLSQFVLALVAAMPRARLFEGAADWADERDELGLFSAQRLMARIVGIVLAEDRRLTRRLLWRYLETHAPLEEEDWRAWLGVFQRHVRATVRCRKRQAGGLVSWVRKLLRLVLGKPRPEGALARESPAGISRQTTNEAVPAEKPDQRSNASRHVARRNKH